MTDETAIFLREMLVISLSHAFSLSLNKQKATRCIHSSVINKVGGQKKSVTRLTYNCGKNKFLICGNWISLTNIHSDKVLSLEVSFSLLHNKSSLSWRNSIVTVWYESTKHYYQNWNASDISAVWLSKAASFFFFYTFYLSDESAKSFIAN